MRKPLALTLLLTLPALTVAAQFRDVPRSHWAYSAIHKLVDAGMIQGKKGNFQGHKAFTRYEMAVVLARYLERMTSSRGAIAGSMEKTYPLVKRLTNEFREELEILGVRHQEILARVTSLETRADMHQRELMELRTLIQENRRYLASAGVQAPPVGPSVTERRRQLASSRPAPAPMSRQYQPRPQAAPVQYRAPAPAPQQPYRPQPVQPQYRPSAPQPQQTAARPRYQAPMPPAYRPQPAPAYRAPVATRPPMPQSYSAPIPVPAAPQRFAPAPRGPAAFANASNSSGGSQGQDAARLHSLRMRARGLMSSGLRRNNSGYQQAASRPAPRRSSAPKFGLDMSSAPSQRQAPQANRGASSQGFAPSAPAGQDRVSTASILDTIDQVRSGKMDPASADRFAGGVERAMGSSPLHQRLFGSMGFGPPASD